MSQSTPSGHAPWSAGAAPKSEDILDSESLVLARDSVFVFDPGTFAFLDANDRALAFLGVSRDALPSCSLRELARDGAPFDETQLRHELGRAIELGSSRFEWRTKSADGDVVWLDAFAKITRSHGVRRLVVFAEDISAEKGTLDALWRTTAYLSAALEQSPAAIVVVDAPDGRVRLTNGAADALRCASTDDDFETVYSIRLADLDGTAVPHERHPLARALFLGESTDNARFTVEIAHGRTKTVLVHAAPIRDGRGAIVAAIAVISDITEVVRAESAVRDRDRLVRRFYENVRDVMLSLDESGTIVALSPSVEQVFGFPPSALIGRRIAETGFVDPESLPRAEFDRQRVIAGEVLAPSEYVYRNASGARRIGEVTGSPVDAGGGRRLALLVIRDVTERRDADERRAQMEAALRQRQRLEIVGALASGVAHDINNPLTGLLNLGEMLELGLVKPDEMKPTGARVIALCERMSAIVSRLLTLARAETTESEIVDLVSLATDCVDLMGQPLRRAHVAVTVQSDPERPRIRGRAQALEQAVVNVIGNAIDSLATLPPDRPRTIAIRVRSIDLGGEKGARITVSDNGPGIDPSVVSTMFEPFVSTKSTSLGAGLGLWVALCVAVEHGGRIHHEPCSSTGACFHLDLPTAIEPKTAIASPR